jgi:undecaprenyl-diphosphatase
MAIFDALILSVVEGITEFLPISSTGHLILASKLLGLGESDFLKTFEIAIQAGAILSVLVLYGFVLLKNRAIFVRVAASFIPTAAVGFVLYKIIKHYFLGNVWLTLTMLFVGGILLVFSDSFAKSEGRKIEDLSLKEYAALGLIQSLSVVPGVSRAAATILGGTWLGLSREAAVEFSFLLAVPTMFAATGYDLLKSASAFSSNDLGILAVGCAASFISALVVVKWFLNYAKKYSFRAFGIYRIILAIVFGLFMLK